MKAPHKNILIVDDDASHRMLLGRILENAGWVSEEAESVREAIAKIQAKVPDLIILDLNMPEHDGFTLLQFRKQNRLLQNIPILVLSSANDQLSVERALTLGANQYVVKPLQANLVLQKMRSLFYTQENDSYELPKGEETGVEVEMNGLLVGRGEGKLRISCVGKFERGMPLEVKIENYVRAGGAALVGRVDNTRVPVREGLFVQVLTLMGLSREEGDRLDKWNRNN